MSPQWLMVWKRARRTGPGSARVRARTTGSVARGRQRRQAAAQGAATTVRPNRAVPATQARLYPATAGVGRVWADQRLGRSAGGEWELVRFRMAQARRNSRHGARAP